MHEEGRQIRARGTDTASSSSFRILDLLPQRRIARLDLEPADPLRHEPASQPAHEERPDLARAVTAVFGLAAYRAQREHFGKLVDVEVHDEDQIIFLADDSPFESLPRLVPTDGDFLRFALGTDPSIHLSSDIKPSDPKAVAVPAGSFVECSPAAGAPESSPSAPAGRPYFRIWHVPLPS